MFFTNIIQIQAAAPAKSSGIDPALLERIRANDPTIRWLDFTHRYIGDAGAQALAEALRVNHTITEINLGRNQIGDVGVQAIADVLKVNRTITTIYLSGNRIGATGAQALANALRVNHTIITIDIADNQIGGAGAQAIAAALRENGTITTSHLDENKIGGVGAQAIAEALRVNHTITRIDLRGNQIGDDEAQAIAEALKNNHTITAILLKGNQIGEAGVQAIADVLENNITITVLSGISNPRIHALLERNKELAKERFIENIKVIMGADRSSVKNVPYGAWIQVARFLGYPEEFIQKELRPIMDEAQMRTKSIEEMIAHIKERLNERALKLGIRSSQMGPGNTEEDLSAISNEESLQMVRLRAIYNQQPEEVKKEFSFHRWLRMQSSFYDKEMRNAAEPKPTFEEWLRQK